jgi:two-component system response regulator HydG
MLRDERDGFDVAASLRQARPELQTIVITGYPSPSIAQRLGEPGIFAFFEKPFDPEELCDAVRRATGGQEPS